MPYCKPAFLAALLVNFAASLAAPTTEPTTSVACFTPTPGWITCPHATGRLVCVADNGDDSAPGTEAQPVRTIHRAYQMLANSGDLIALRRGDSFTETGIEWKITGTASAYTGIVTYGDADAAPVWNCDTTGILILNNDSRGFLFFDGFDLVCPRRDPSSPNFSVANATTGPAKPVGALPASIKAPVGLQIVATVSNLVIQDVTFQWFDDDLSIQCPNLDTTSAFSQNIVLHRCRIEDSWSLNQYGGQGIYASNIHGLTFSDCTFAENAHRNPADAAFIQPTIYRHAMYLSGYPSSGPATVTNCLVYSPSSYGLQARAGGTITDCYFSDCGIACLLAGASGTFSSNVIQGGHQHTSGPIVGTGKGGITFTSGTGSVTGNIFADEPAATPAVAATICSFPIAAIDLGRSQWSPPVVSGTVTGNIVAGWWGIGIEIDGDFDSAAVTGNTLLRTGRLPVANALDQPVSPRPGISVQGNSTADVFIASHLPDQSELITRARAQRRPTWNSDNTASAAIEAARLNFTPRPPATAPAQ